MNRQIKDLHNLFYVSYLIYFYRFWNPSSASAPIEVPVESSRLGKHFYFNCEGNTFIFYSKDTCKRLVAVSCYCKYFLIKDTCKRLVAAILLL